MNENEIWLADKREEEFAMIGQSFIATFKLKTNFVIHIYRIISAIVITDGSWCRLKR